MLVQKIKGGEENREINPKEAEIKATGAATTTHCINMQLGGLRGRKGASRRILGKWQERVEEDLRLHDSGCQQ